MTDAQANSMATYVVGTLFLLTGIANLIWPERMIARVNRQALGTWRMRLILSPFPEKNRTLVIRVVALLCLLAAWFAFTGK